MPTHIARRDLGRTAWLQALAYATTATTRSGNARQHPHAWARVAWAGIVVAHCVIGHRNLYLTRSRLGAIAFYWNPPLGMMARGVVLLVPLIASTFASSPLFTSAVTLAYLVLVGSMSASVALTGRRSKAPKGAAKIARPWKHYVIGLAAAHPRAPRGETALLGKALMDQVPTGSTVVVHPRTTALRRSYERAGFVPSKGMEMMRRTA